MYTALCQCQVLHPDPEEEIEEGIAGKLQVFVSAFIDLQLVFLTFQPQPVYQYINSSYIILTK